MSIISSIILFLLIIITLFNLYAQTIGKKRKDEGMKQYKKEAADLESLAWKEMQERNLKFDEKHLYLNDKGQGILLVFDNTQKKLALFMRDACTIFPFSDLETCEVKKNADKGKIWNIRVDITTADTIYTYMFGETKRSSKSYFSRFIQKDATEFRDVIKQHVGLS